MVKGEVLVPMGDVFLAEEVKGFEEFLVTNGDFEVLFLSKGLLFVEVCCPRRPLPVLFLSNGLLFWPLVKGFPPLPILVPVL